MPSDRRLHPLSPLFGLGAQLRTFGLPGLVVLVTAGAVGLSWQVWMMPLLIPALIALLGEYLTFRYRYEAHEMVIRKGLLSRSERHIPYARIQNLDAVQNVLHRLLDVVEVRIETGGGGEPEAKLRVLPVADYEEMRRRVFAQRVPAAVPEQADAASPISAAGRTLLHLPGREILLLGLLQNRGAVILAAGFGLLWELGMMDRAMDVVPDDRAGSIIRAVFSALAGRGDLPVGRIALAGAALAGLLLFLRLLSMVWAAVQLHGFRLTLVGEDLRTEYGLLTRVFATIPLCRIQTLTIRESPLYRRFGRVSVRVDTAGGERGEEGEKRQREWLAPILRRRELPGLLREVLPGLDLAAVGWRAAPPRAFRRVLRQWVLVALVISPPLALPFLLLLPKWWYLVLLAVLLAWAFLMARLDFAHLGWAVAGDAVLFRRGALWRQTSAAPFGKIQAVAIHESPFDRRHAMARVKVDTAGAGNASHRVDVPYLPRETAQSLYDLLAAEAAGTAFRW